MSGIRPQTSRSRSVVQRDSDSDSCMLKGNSDRCALSVEMRKSLKAITRMGFRRDTRKLSGIAKRIAWDVCRALRRTHMTPRKNSGRSSSAV